MNDWLLEWIAIYGLPAFFIILMIAQVGVPMPITLMLIVIGSIVGQGDLTLWQVVILGAAGAATGDLIGYLLGRTGGRRLINRFSSRMGGEDNLKKAEEFSRRWGDMGIFFSRWLVTPLGPWLNLTSGAIVYPLRRFAFWVLLGEIVWVFLFVMLGWLFSDRVQYVTDLMGNLTWVIFGLFIAGFIAWQFRGFFLNDQPAGDQDEKIPIVKGGRRANAD